MFIYIFLHHIFPQACDALFHLCRTFEDPDITHVEGDVNPIRDLDIINEELKEKVLRWGTKISEARIKDSTPSFLQGIAVPAQTRSSSRDIQIWPEKVTVTKIYSGEWSNKPCIQPGTSSMKINLENSKSATK